MKRTLLAVATMIMLITGLTTPASAGDDPTLASGGITAMAGPCGSSYSHIGHYPIKSGGTTLAHLDVYWSSSANRNCLVTNHHGSTYGERMYTEARIRPSGWGWPSCPSSTGCDGGMYSYYAGPVYTPSGVNMTNRCVDFGGWIDWKKRFLYGRHCG